MRSWILRTIVVLIALGSQAGAGFKIWEIEQRAAVERNAGDSFERQARQMTLGLANLQAAFQAYVADGQNAESWQKTAAGLLQTLTAQGRSLRAAARSPEAQGAVEDAVELVAALGKTEARARDYVASEQRLSASDVVFAEAAPQAVKAASAIDLARGQEDIASAGTLERMRVQQLYFLGGAAAVTLLALIVLLPVPRASAPDVEEEGEPVLTDAPGLGLSHAVPARSKAPPPDAGLPLAAFREDIAPVTPAASAIDLEGAADVCVALARVQEPRELPALLERAAGVLGAGGIVVWMPDGPQGALRPALAHGYTPLAVTRMGTIPTDANNAAAIAFRTQSAQLVPAEGGVSGAVAAPLLTADGCSGVMAAELLTTDHVDQTRAVASIIAAQLATLISPAQATAERPAE